MRKNIFKLLMLIAVVLCSIPLSAAEITINGMTYTYDSTSKTAILKSGESMSGEVVIPSTIQAGSEDYSVVEIGESAFHSNTGITSVFIPSTVTTIRSWAFKQCTSLKKIAIPNSVVNIYTAFGECNAIEEVHISGNFKLSEIFPNSRSSIKKIVVNAETTALCDYAFKDCTKVTQIVLPSTLSCLGKECFANCYALEDLTSLSSTSVTIISVSAFSGCRNLTAIPPLNKIHTIGNSAFDGCTSIHSITIPSSVLSIADGAFRNMTSLKSLTIEDSEEPLEWGLGGSTSFSSYPMIGASRIENAYVGREIKKYGTNNYIYMFQYQENLSTIELSENVKTIHDGMFENCYSLTNTTFLPSSVETIKSYAFLNTKGLTSIYIPDCVMSIEYDAFSNYTSVPSLVTKITFHNSTLPTIATTAFKNIPTTAKLYVPKNTKDAYKTAMNWVASNVIENHFDMENDNNIDIVVTSAKWSTIILPFDAEIPFGLKVYSCDAEDGNMLSIVEQSEIVANTPYLINGNEDTYHFAKKGSAWEDTYNAGWFTGAYVETTVPENSYILAKVNGALGFYKVTGENVGKTKIAPYHCYLTPSTGSSSKSTFFIDDMTTGISTVTNTETDKTTIFDLYGRRLSEPHKGINIVNGKKIIIK